MFVIKLLSPLVLLGLVNHVTATWSAILVDVVTREIGMQSVTCVEGLDLPRATAVVVPGVGGAFVQSYADFEGSRRPILREGLLNGTAPAQILQAVSMISGHQDRQYGIANAVDEPAVFSGSLNGEFAGGVHGQVGNIKYSIQGNVLAGACVVDAIEQYVISAALNGSTIPDMVMKSTQVARQAGGDGRCSCSVFNTEECGCPPSNFRKAGHTGFLLYTIPTDMDSPKCGQTGCVEGNYQMFLNAAGLADSDEDPVVILRVLYDDWQAQRSPHSPEHSTHSHERSPQSPQHIRRTRRPRIR